MLFLRQLKSVAGDKMRIRPKRHHKTTANPVKSLQQRNDVRTDTEVKSLPVLKFLRCHYCHLVAYN